ncbi:MAG TPA: hypothetical protein VGF45_06240, partial [Polyangia bacterium]
ESAEAKPTVLLALAVSGNVAAMPSLLAALRDPLPAIRKLALQAIAAITGLSLDESAYLLPPPIPAAPPPPPPEDDDSDAEAELPPAEDDPEAEAALPPLEEDELDVAPMPVPEELLDEPNADAIALWWQKNQSAFPADRRLLGGQLFSPAAVAGFLEKGRMRLRHVVALSVAVRSSGVIWPNTRGFSDAQKRDLGVLAAAKPHLLQGRTAGW